MALSNSISDFILFLTALLWFLGANRGIKDPKLRFRWDLFPVLIGLTAFTGSIRFAGFDAITPVSGVLQYAATTVGVVGLVFAIIQSYEGRIWNRAFLVLLALAVGLFIALLSGAPGWWGLLLQGPAILAILILALMQFRKDGLVASLTLLALVFLAASALKGMVGQALGSAGLTLDKTDLNDLQHYMMAGAFLLFFLIVRRVR